MNSVLERLKETSHFLNQSLIFSRSELSRGAELNGFSTVQKFCHKNMTNNYYKATFNLGEKKNNLHTINQNSMMNFNTCCLFMMIKDNIDFDSKMMIM